MAMSQSELNKNMKVQKLKDDVDPIIQAYDDGALGELTSTGLARAIEVLCESVKNRASLGKSLGSDSGHAHRLLLEQSVLSELNRISSDRVAFTKAEVTRLANERALNEKKERDKKKALDKNDSYPTLGQAAGMQKGKTVYQREVQKPGPVWGGKRDWK